MIHLSLRFLGCIARARTVLGEVMSCLSPDIDLPEFTRRLPEAIIVSLSLEPLDQDPLAGRAVDLLLLRPIG